MDDRLILLIEDNSDDELLILHALGKTGFSDSYARKPADFGQFSESVQQLGLYWLLLSKTLR